MPYLPSDEPGHDSEALRAAGALPERIAGRYQVSERLGAGAFGTVVRARDTLARHDVAIKLLPRKLGAARLRREIVALRVLRLPGVVQLLDEGIDDPWFFLVMELVRGSPFPGQTAPMPWTALRAPALSLLEIMGRVHAAGALHLDLKPANVHVLADGTVRVLDLGLAGGPALGGAAPPGHHDGTWRYMAPEQRDAGRADPRSDLYAIGVLLHEALTGAAPGRAHARLAELAADAPPEVCALVDALLARDPGDRPASAWAALERLGSDPSDAGLPIADRADMDEHALRRCFHGPERLLHIPGQAARRLLRRTGPDRDRIAAELRAWIRAGVATPRGDRLHIHGPAFLHIDRLLPGYQPHDRDSELARLIHQGAFERVPALAARIAHGHLCEGRAERARMALEQALIVIRRGHVDAAHEPALLDLWALLALEERTPQALDQALYELGRATRDSDHGRALETLLKAALLYMQGDHSRAQDALFRLAPFEHRDPASRSLDQWRQSLAIQLAAVHGPAHHRAAVARALAWARQQRSPQRSPAGQPDIDRNIDIDSATHIDIATDTVNDIHARALGWVGRLRYMQGRFAEAARWQERAARRAGSFLLRLSSQYNSASAWMEAGHYGQARRLAHLALCEARRHTQPVHEAHAEWLLRSISYRAGEATAPDRELVAAAEHLHVPYLEGLIALNEAAVCWRAGDDGQARELATRARLCFEASGQRAAQALARAVELRCSPASPAVHAAMRDLAGQVMTRPMPDITWQVLGMLAGAAENLAKHARRHARDQRDPERRRELLAPAEILAPSF